MCCWSKHTISALLQNPLNLLPIALYLHLFLGRPQLCFLFLFFQVLALSSSHRLGDRVDVNCGERCFPELGPAVPGCTPAWRGAPSEQTSFTAFIQILPFGLEPLSVKIKKGEATRFEESPALRSVCKMGHNTRKSVCSR